MSKIGVTLKIDREVTRPVLLERFMYHPKSGELRRKKNSGTAKTGDLAGTLHSSGYIDVRVFGRLLKAHRIIWMMVYGSWPDTEIDHVNRIRNDNRIDNLREVKPFENMRNKPIYTNNKSGIPGVAFCKGKWHAVIKEAPNIQKHIGRYSNIFDAACARKSAELIIGYHENHGRSL